MWSYYHAPPRTPAGGPVMQMCFGFLKRLTNSSLFKAAGTVWVLCGGKTQPSSCWIISVNNNAARRGPVLLRFFSKDIRMNRCYSPSRRLHCFFLTCRHCANISLTALAGGSWRVGVQTFTMLQLRRGQTTLFVFSHLRGETDAACEHETFACFWHQIFWPGNPFGCLYFIFCDISASFVWLWLCGWFFYYSKLRAFIHRNILCQIKAALTWVQPTDGTSQQVPELVAAFVVAVILWEVAAHLLHKHQRPLAQVFFPVPRHAPIGIALSPAVGQWQRSPRRPHLSDRTWRRALLAHPPFNKSWSGNRRRLVAGEACGSPGLDHRDLTDMSVNSLSLKEKKRESWK